MMAQPLTSSANLSRAGSSVGSWFLSLSARSSTKYTVSSSISLSSMICDKWRMKSTIL